MFQDKAWNYFYIDPWLVKMSHVVVTVKNALTQEMPIITVENDQH